MAADYTRTIIFKVEDQAIKRATNQIVTSLKKIEETLSRIEKKGFNRIARDASKAAGEIDKTTAAMKKFTKELERSEKQKLLPSAKLALPPGMSRFQQFQKRARKGMGILGGVGAAGIAASSLAIKSLNTQYNHLIGVTNKVTSALGPLGQRFEIAEANTNGLSITLKSLGHVIQHHPLVSGVLAVAIFALGADTKNTTTAFMWLGKTINNISRPIRRLAADFNPVEWALRRVTGEALLTTKSLKGLSGGATFRRGGADIPPGFRTVDVDPIVGDFNAIPNQLKFEEYHRARGNDVRQKLGLGGRVAQNVQASRNARSASGFGDWEARQRGIATASARDKILQSIERKNKRLVKQGKEKLNTERMINREMKKQLGITKKIDGMFTDRARKERRMGAKIRWAGSKMGMNRLDAKGAESLMLGAGFPMLFGGGVGAVGGGLGGSILGNAMGMGGFGTQIIGSAIGTQLEQLHNRVVQIGNATQTLNMDQLEESGIRVNAELEIQINRLKKIGDFEKAEKKLEREVSRQTGSVGTTNKDIANNVAMLQNVWDSLLAAAGTTIGIIATPFVTALAAILKLVQLLLVGVNVILSAVGTLFKKIVELIGLLPGGQKLLDGISNAMDNMNGALDNMKVNFQGYLDGLTEEQDKIRQRIELGDKEAAIQQKIAEAVAKYGKENKDKIEKAVRAVAALTEQEKEVKKMEALYKKMGRTIEDGLVNAIEGAIQGTKTLGEVASSVFRQMGRMLLQYGVHSLMGGMFKGTSFGKYLGYKAEGGPVLGGSPYVVGEKGPELFVPNSSGNIVPNHAMGGSMVVNVDASGSSAEGDDDRSRQLGELIGAAVQSEIIRQQRPGGTLY